MELEQLQYACLDVLLGNNSVLNGLKGNAKGKKEEYGL